ncbi:MAG TPA: MATE family efflux transporter [Candidatus Lambdaproteobacteria bacterium]|nr:MATE family efflux transporter [Candidatus Lambdaproteobacteria bacterium]
MTSSPSANTSAQKSGINRMTEGPVGPSLIRLSIPMIFGLVSILLINLVDTFYISLIGVRELVAISFTFPVTFTLMSFSFGIGIGASAVISRAIGEGDHHRVQRLTTDSLLLVALIILCVAGISFISLRSIFTLMGATDESFPLIEEYMIPWLMGVVFVVIPIVGNSAIRATGDTKTPSLIMVIAAVVNAVLDPLLIFGYGPFPELGIQGAAIATVISFISIMLAGLWVLGIRNRMLTANWPGIAEILRSWKALLYIGIPAMLTQLLFPVSNAVLTRIAADLGDATVAAFGVGTRIESLAMIGSMALSSVIIPFIGQNYGAQNFDRIKDASRFLLRFALVWGASVWAILALISGGIAWAFTDDPEIQNFIQQFFWIVPFGFAFHGISQLISASCNALHRPFHSTTINILRLFLFLIPLVYLGSQIWGTTGFFFGIALGNLATGGIAWFWFRSTILPGALSE